MSANDFEERMRKIEPRDSGEKATSKSAPRRAQATLAFVGDVCFGAGIHHRLMNDRQWDPLRDITPILAKADLRIGNFELALSSGPVGQMQGSNSMIVPPEAMERISSLPFDIFGLANNHIMDAGPEGLREATQYLCARGISVFGAGRNIEEAERPLVIEVNGLKIAFLGACGVGAGQAGRNSPGVAALEETRILERIIAARSENDIVVAFVHDDLEFSHSPAPSRVRLSRRMIDCGAHAVVQHHPHVCQGIERYRDGIIAYSLGNFLFPVSGNTYMQRSANTNWGIVLMLHLEIWKEKIRIDWEAIPITIANDDTPSPSGEYDAEWQVKALNEWSLGLRDPDWIRRQWSRRCWLEAKATYYVLAHERERGGLGSMIRAAADLFGDRNERRWVYGLMTNGIVG